MSKRIKRPINLSPRRAILAFAGALFIFSMLAAALAVRQAQASSGGFFASPAGLFSALSGSPQSPGIWEFIDQSAVQSAGERQIVPQVYRTARVNEDALRQLLAKAPLEFTPESKNNPLIFAMPMPDGTFMRFQIEDSPIMEAPLAAQYPELKTYRGQGIDDPTMTTRFDLTPTGFHAIILSEHGTVYIDPYAKGDTTNYITYFKHDYQNETKAFRCDFVDDGSAPQSANQPAATAVSNGTTLRTYRIAVAATGEYTTFFGGTVANGLAAITTAMNRINGVYEREVAVRMTIIANNNLIIYTNGGTDPYTNSSGSAMLGQNQTNIDTVIGSANYDIGHVFSTGGGGVATLSCVCNNSTKARGVTGNTAPVGDSFYIDYVAHEIGHQFGALHTFNGTASNCGGGNRSASAAYETGSGTTIMAYAGICSTQNTQLHSDDYFHVKSLEQIVTFIGGNTCDVETATGNTVPTVSVGSTVNIPRSTPFMLTATASDPNGDTLTYGWEEYDLGTASPPDTDAGGISRPVLRSYNNSTNPSRTFPKLQYILNNANVPPTNYACSSSTCLTGEILPSISRTMTFQVTVRDNRANGGGINTATQSVIVSGTAGPFVVTAPNTAINWTGGSAQNVTWDVAGTTAAPISAANVMISMSTDGGNTFPTVLAASTPNDGSESILVPNLTTTTARIKVEAVGNIFFDISDTNFSITSGGPIVGSTTIGIYRGATSTFYLRNTNSVGFADIQVPYGGVGDIALTGDWDGDGDTTIGVYRPSTSTFYLRNTNSIGFADIQVPYGGVGDLPIVGDWDGDGDVTIGVYRPSTSTFYLRNNNSIGFADIQVPYGGVGDVPLVGDWDGNGTTTIGLYRPANQTFYLRNANTIGFADIQVPYGAPGDTPLAGDWDGDGDVTIGIYRPTSATFFLRNTNTIGVADIVVPYGAVGDTPVVGDWDGL